MRRVLWPSATGDRPPRNAEAPPSNYRQGFGFSELRRQDLNCDLRVMSPEAPIGQVGVTPSVPCCPAKLAELAVHSGTRLSTRIPSGLDAFWTRFHPLTLDPGRRPEVSAATAGVEQLPQDVYRKVRAPSSAASRARHTATRHKTGAFIPG